ncbi:hypothetical protein DL93DRAFT_277096 [Clavulina sp. PMI_390]|nr:hypothetical protein DL93DRAFT_277096 [Clavulina sp. PMI_390]
MSTNGDKEHYKISKSAANPFPSLRSSLPIFTEDKSPIALPAPSETIPRRHRKDIVIWRPSIFSPGELARRKRCRKYAEISERCNSRYFTTLWQNAGLDVRLPPPDLSVRAIELVF